MIVSLARPQDLAQRVAQPLLASPLAPFGINNPAPSSAWVKKRSLTEGPFPIPPPSLHEYKLGFLVMILNPLPHSACHSVSVGHVCLIKQSKKQVSV